MQETELLLRSEKEEYRSLREQGVIKLFSVRGSAIVFLNLFSLFFFLSLSLSVSFFIPLSVF